MRKTILQEHSTKKYQILRNDDYFENRLSCKIAHAKPIAFAKSLGQKLKIPKTCEKRFYKH